MIPPERGTADFAKIELPGGGGVASAFAMSRLYAMLANGGELDGVRLLKSETIELARRQRSEGNDPLGGRFLRFGVGFELNPNPSCLGMPADAFGHTGAGGSTHGAWPSLRTSFRMPWANSNQRTMTGAQNSYLMLFTVALRVVNGPANLACAFQKTQWCLLWHPVNQSPCDMHDCHEESTLRQRSRRFLTSA